MTDLMSKQETQGARGKFLISAFLDYMSQSAISHHPFMESKTWECHCQHSVLVLSTADLVFGQVFVALFVIASSLHALLQLSP